MSSITKINYTQKEILGNFMSQHTDLAKGILPNNSQGRAKANQLWEQLTAKLNASGPPTKDVKSWRKVYSDQKQNVKSKFAFNKLSKKKTGGGPYEEKVLSHVEEQILAAAGIEVAVEGLKTVKSFGSQILKYLPQDDDNYPSTSQQKSTTYLCTSPQLLDDSGDENMLPADISYIIASEDEIQSEPIKKEARFKKLPTDDQRLKQSKTTLLQQNLISAEVYQKELLSRLDKLIEIKNKKLQLKEKEIELSGQLNDMKAKSLKMKEREHQLTIQIKEMELMIKKGIGEVKP